MGFKFNECPHLLNFMSLLLNSRAFLDSAKTRYMVHVSVLSNSANVYCNFICSELEHTAYWNARYYKRHLEESHKHIMYLFIVRPYWSKDHGKSYNKDTPVYIQMSWLTTLHLPIELTNILKMTIAKEKYRWNLCLLVSSILGSIWLSNSTTVIIQVTQHWYTKKSVR